MDYQRQLSAISSVARQLPASRRASPRSFFQLTSRQINQSPFSPACLPVLRALPAVCRSFSRSHSLPPLAARCQLPAVLPSPVRCQLPPARCLLFFPARCQLPAVLRPPSLPAASCLLPPVLSCSLRSLPHQRIPQTVVTAPGRSGGSATAKDATSRGIVKSGDVWTTPSDCHTGVLDPTYRESD